MSATSDGRLAEKLVADYLASKGHTVIALNWRTRWCEIDVISKDKKIVYFTEVKFRKTAYWGDGLSYITPQKVKQMRFAAEFWMHTQNHQYDARLQVASVGPAGLESIIVLDDD